MRLSCNKAPFIPALLALTLLFNGGCEEADPTPEPELTTPTLNPVPSRTNAHELEISGTRSPGTLVWFQLRAGSTPTEIIGSPKLPTWSGTVLLNEGYNSFVVFASDADAVTFSPPGPEVEVEVDTTPPECPTAINAPASVDLSHTESLVLPLEGTKGADGNLLINGVLTIPSDGLSRWSAPVTLHRGENPFTLTSSDDLGNTTTDTHCPTESSLSIFGSQIPPPTFANLPEGTSNTSLSLSGTKPGGTLLYLSRWLQSEPPSAAVQVEVPADPAATSWTLSSLQWSEGVYTLSLHATEPESGYTSPVVNATLLVDSIPPGPPLLAPFTSPISDPTVLLSGTKDPDSEICVHVNQSTPCTPLIPFEPTTNFSAEVPVPLGANTIELVARDGLLNQSAPLEVPVLRLPLPEISALSPPHQKLIISPSLTASATVRGGSIPGSEITTVTLCLDASCVTVPPTEDAPTHFAHPFDLTGLPPGTTHSLTCHATNAGGISHSETVEVLFNPGHFLLSQNDAPPSPVSTVTSPDGTLHVVWEGKCAESPACPEGSVPETKDILYRRFSPFGGGFSAVQLISSDGDSRAPVITIAPSGELLILWQDNGDLDQDGVPEYDLYSRRLSPETFTLSPPALVTSSQTNDSEPSVDTASDGSVHLAWTREVFAGNRDIYYSRYAFGAWAAPLLVSDHENDGDSYSPALKTDSGQTAHIVWVDHGDFVYRQNQIPRQTNTDSDVVYRRVRDGALQDAKYIHVSGDYPHDDTACDQCQASSQDPTLAVTSDDRVYVVWVDTAPHGQEEADGLSSVDPDIYLRRYKNGDSLDVSSTGRVTIHPVDSGSSSLTSSAPELTLTSSEQALILWTETDDTGKSHLAFSEEYLAADTGIWFTPVTPLTSPGPGPIHSSLNRDVFDNLHAAWSQPTLLDPDSTAVVFLDPPPELALTPTALLYTLIETGD